MKNLLYALVLINSLAFAQEETRTMDIDLTSFCKDDSEVSQEIVINKEKERTCAQIRELEGKDIAPIVDIVHKLVHAPTRFHQKSA